MTDSRHFIDFNINELYCRSYILSCSYTFLSLITTSSLIESSVYITYSQSSCSHINSCHSIFLFVLLYFRNFPKIEIYHKVNDYLFFLQLPKYFTKENYLFAHTSHAESSFTHFILIYIIFLISLCLKHMGLLSL